MKDAEVTGWIDDIDFANVYDKVVESLTTGFKFVFSFDVKSRLAGMGESLSQYQGYKLSDFLQEDSLGKIQIQDARYNVSRDYFRLLNIETFELLTSLVNKAGSKLLSSGELAQRTSYQPDLFSSFKREFFIKLRRELAKHIYHKNVNLYAYDSINDFILSTINSSILNTCILKIKDSSIYKDYREIVNK